jgi:hypothetical protein
LFAALFAFVAAIAAIATALFIYFQIQEQRVQLQEQRVEQRAWFGAPHISTSPTGDSRWVRFDYIFKNVGHTPNRGFYINATIKDTLDDSWKELADTMCAVEKEEPYVAVPNEEYILDRMPSLNPGITPEQLNSMKDPSIVGCISYGILSDSKPHVTKFRGVINRDSGKILVYAFGPS